MLTDFHPVPTLEEGVREKARRDLRDEIAAAMAPFERLDSTAETLLVGPDGAHYRTWQLLQALAATLFDDMAPLRERIALEAFARRDEPAREPGR